MDPDSVVKLALSLPFAVFVSVWLLWRIDPLLQRLVAVEEAELELLRLSASRDLGAETVDRVLEKHGVDKK